MKTDWALVTPLANEASSFKELVSQITIILDLIGSGTVYFVVDNASRDNTLDLCQQQGREDARFQTVWAPHTKNIVDAYLAGFKTAFNNNHSFFIEMDGGLSHNPSQILQMLTFLTKGYDCVFGTRFLISGSYNSPPLKRLALSRLGTYLANTLLDTNQTDMTSGFQGFSRDMLRLLLDFPLKSEGHFYQTEVRYLFRFSNFKEIPITYNSPSPRVSKASIINSISVLLYYMFHSTCIIPRRKLSKT